MKVSVKVNPKSEIWIFPTGYSFTVASVFAFGSKARGRSCPTSQVPWFKHTKRHAMFLMHRPCGSWYGWLYTRFNMMFSRGKMKWNENPKPSPCETWTLCSIVTSIRTNATRVDAWQSKYAQTWTPASLKLCEFSVSNKANETNIDSRDGRRKTHEMHKRMSWNCRRNRRLKTVKRRKSPRRVRMLP